MQISSYAIVKRPDLVVAEYESARFARQNKKNLKKLRAALPFVEPAAYRGISRMPLMPFFLTDPEDLKEYARCGLDVYTERAGRKRIRELIGEDRVQDYDNVDGDLLDTEDQAREVWDLLQDPASYEIIQLRRGEYLETEELLGFDVGYWGGDLFSIIADAAITPTWHPPAERDFKALSENLQKLNNNVLFDSADKANRFREWYLTRPWAETESEPGEFVIIQVIEVTTVD